MSVHLTDFPTADESRINRDLSADTQLAMRVCGLGRAARSQANVKVRQPLAQAIVKVNSARDRDGLIRIMPQILEELNVKTLAFADKVEELNMPQFCVGTEGEVSVAIPREVSAGLAEEGWRGKLSTVSKPYEKRPVLKSPTILSHTIMVTTMLSR